MSGLLGTDKQHTCSSHILNISYYTHEVVLCFGFMVCEETLGNVYSRLSATNELLDSFFPPQPNSDADVSLLLVILM